MSSTNKTANLGLNLWAAGDVEQAADLNADNNKIDAAIGNLRAGGGSPLVKIADVSFSPPASPYVLDLSGINVDDFCELIIYMEFNGNEKMYIGLNSEFYKYTLTTPSQYNSEAGNIMLGPGINRLSVSKPCFTVRSDSYFQITTASRSNFPTLTNIRFASEKGGFLGGERLIVWGLKK